MKVWKTRHLISPVPPHCRCAWPWGLSSLQLLSGAAAWLAKRALWGGERQQPSKSQAQGPCGSSWPRGDLVSHMNLGFSARGEGLVVCHVSWLTPVRGRACGCAVQQGHLGKQAPAPAPAPLPALGGRGHQALRFCGYRELSIIMVPVVLVYHCTPGCLVCISANPAC